ncbi:MAG: hypothetical protein FJ096_06620, partial [Deltaproteobacteria bacterium]|nr:hypothetical protein [Deltaproteobacteria bacterium]
MTPRAATLSVVVLATLAASAGCPRYAPVEASTTTAAGGAGGQGGRGGAGGAGGQGGGSNSVCTKVCTTIFECGLIVDNGKPLCPGFSSGETKLEVFLSGDENVPGCVATCAENAALQTTDPSDD